MAYTEYLESVQQLYVAYYGRPGEAAGLEQWAKAADAAGSVESIVDAFGNSPEAAVLYEGMSTEQVVNSIYVRLFGRDAEPLALTEWSGQIRSGALSAADAAWTIMKGALGTDATAVDNKLTAASEFTRAIDTTPEILAYSGYDAVDIASAWLATVDSTAASLTAALASLGTTIDSIVTESQNENVQTFTLTTGADALTGGGGSDMFVATEDTLSSADILNGGQGTDTLRYASSGAFFVNEAGFEASSIETIQVTSDATGGTTFDVTGVTDLVTLRNYNSSEGLTLSGMDGLVAVELTSIGSAGALAIDPSPDTTLVFDAAVVAGAADALNVTLDGNLNVDGTAIGDLTANGIETFNVTTTGAASEMNSLASNSLKAMTIAGDQDLTLAAANFFGTSAVNTVDASTFTGDLNLTLTNDNAVNIDVDVTGGTGDDRVSFTSFDAGDAFDGAAGTDTIGLTSVVAEGLPAGTLANVEILEVTTPSAGGDGIVDMDDFSGVGTVYYSAGLGGATTVDDAVTGITVKVDVGAVAQNLTVDLKTDGASDVVNLQLNKIGAADNLGIVTVDDAETLNINVSDDAAVDGTGVLTIASLALTDTTTLNLSSNADLRVTFANVATPQLAVLDGSTSTGDLTIVAADFAAAGATITLGSGDDTLDLTGSTAAGADTIDLSQGGDDTVIYTAVAQSTGITSDTVVGFESGDVIDVTALGVVASARFLGNAVDTTAAETELTAGTITAIYVQSDSALIVDANADGNIGDGDLRVVMDGVTSMTAADLGFGTGVTFTANVAPFDTSVAADSTEGNAVTNEDDTINATVAQINNVGTVIDGLLGEDVLNISATAAAGEIATLDVIGYGNWFGNVETVNLDNTVEGIFLGDTEVPTVDTLTGVAGKNQSLGVEGFWATADLTAMDISNIETLLVGTDAEINVDNLASFQTITGDGTAILQLTGAAATDDFDFSDVAMTGVDTLTLNTADVVTLDAADLADVTTINGAADADLIVNNTVNVTGIAVTDGAVASIAVAGTLTIDNLTDGDIFETMTGTGGSRTLTIAAGGATNIADLTGFTTINAAALADGDLVTLDDDLTDSAVAITIGDSDLNVTGTSTDALTVNALGGVATQNITTADGADTVNINVAATTATVNTGAGFDVINAGNFLTVADAINGGAGTDILYVDDDTAVTDLDGVTNVEYISINNTNVSSYTPADTVIAAGEFAYFNAVGSAAAVTMDFSAELDGYVYFDASDYGDTITLASNNLMDQYTLGDGADALTLDANNTVANLATVDTIIDFNLAGADTINVTNAGAGTWSVTLASTALATFVGDINGVLNSIVGYAGAAAIGDAVIVTVSGGGLAGTYLISDTTAGLGINATAEVVKLENPGVVTAANLI